MAGTKRASVGDPESSSASRKRARQADPHAEAKAFLDEVVNTPDGDDDYPFPKDPAVLFESLLGVAQYVLDLEKQLKAANNAAAEVAEASKKSPEEMAEAAEKIRKAAVAGIKKQMSWKPTCKANRAKWSYDGICPDPEVFGYLFKQNGPPKWKTKKLTKDEFKDCVGSINASARYSSLYITGTHVNVHWSATGEFKLSGTYGVDY